MIERRSPRSCSRCATAWCAWRPARNRGRQRRRRINHRDTEDTEKESTEKTKERVREGVYLLFSLLSSLCFFFSVSSVSLWLILFTTVVQARRSSCSEIGRASCRERV